ncbi:MAG: hypothetical protein A2W31_05120 [Planctomycetes bacterium RBG_16_64_10]|nr:MAG: hypothetical protein A2W31_05120 [Planctomycetes bacterium RBG_16_64_10]
MGHRGGKAMKRASSIAQERDSLAKQLREVKAALEEWRKLSLIGSRERDEARAALAVCKAECRELRATSRTRLTAASACINGQRISWRQIDDHAVEFTVQGDPMNWLPEGDHA